MKEMALLFYTNLSHVRDFFMTACITGYIGSSKITYEIGHVPTLARLI